METSHTRKILSWSTCCLLITTVCWVQCGEVEVCTLVSAVYREWTVSERENRRITVLIGAEKSQSCEIGVQFQLSTDSSWSQWNKQQLSELSDILPPRCTKCLMMKKWDWELCMNSETVSHYSAAVYWRVKRKNSVRWFKSNCSNQKVLS